MLDLSIIVISFNTKKLTLNCINSIIDKTHGINYELIVVDNASSDGSVSAVKKIKFPKLRVLINRKNFGFGRANNQGLKVAKGRYFLLINSDTLVHDNLLCEITSWMDQNPKVGIASCALVNSDGSFQGTGGYFPTPLKVISWMLFLDDLPFIDQIIKPFHPVHSKSFLGKGETFSNQNSERDWVTGAFIFGRRELVDKVGVFGEDYFMYMEEVDWAYRIKKAGWRVYYLPKWAITHLGGASGTKELSVISEIESLKIFYKKHFPSWQWYLVKLFLKIGLMFRIILFGIMEGGDSAKIYAKAFEVA